MANAMTSDKMRNMKMLRLIISMSLPAMLSMLVKALYNIVDSIYVSHYSSTGLDALSIVFPLQTITIALAIAIGVGTNVMVARKLGEKQIEKANILAGTGLFLSGCGIVLMIIIGLFLPEPFMKWFTDDPQIIEDGVIYLQIILFFSFGNFIEITLCRILQAIGNMKVPMISQILGAVTNIILDPVFIFGFWFVPEMGVKGAAIATIIGQVASMVYVILVYVFKKQDVTIALRYLKPRLHYIKEVAQIGLPTFIMNSINSFVTTIMNLVLKAYAYAITIHGVYFKIRSFAFMPVFGMTQGLMPILSYNYGANLVDRFKEARRIGYIFAVSLLTIGLVIFLVIPGTLLDLFNMSGEARELGIYSFRVLAISFIGSAFCIVSSTTLQSIGKSVLSLIITLLRQIILALPFAFILSNLFGFDGVFFCYFLAETIVAILSTPLQWKVVDKAFAKRFEFVKNQQKVA